MWIKQEDVKRAKEVEALPWILENLPEEVKMISPGYYISKEHSSLKLDHGKWMWWSRGVGGRSAVDYLTKVKGYSFTDAVTMILKTTGNASAVSVLPAEPAEKKNADYKHGGVSLPVRDSNNEKLINYLRRREISDNVINFFLRERLMYQEARYKNIVFLGYDYVGRKVELAAIRGTYGRFHSLAPGSDKTYPFRFCQECKDDALHIFEAPVDLLSYATLLEGAGCDFSKTHMISLCGVYKAKDIVENSTIPVALTRYQEEYPDRKNWILHLDNDKTGKSAAEAIMAIAKDVNVYNSPPPSGLDVNDYLMSGGELWKGEWKKNV